MSIPLPADALAFYWELDCPNCDASFHHGLNITLLEHQGRPAIPVDMIGNTTVTCPVCHADIHFINPYEHAWVETAEDA